MSAPILFVDIETLGLSLDAPIWELAIIYRDTDGIDHERHWFVRHRATEDLRLLPPSFRADYWARFEHDMACHRGIIEGALQGLIDQTATAPILVGAVPSFDADRITHQIGVSGWSHRLRCVETLTAGHLGREVGGLGACCKALGIEHRDPHTALGDVRAARDIWDHIITRRCTHPTQPTQEI